MKEPWRRQREGNYDHCLYKRKAVVSLHFLFLAAGWGMLWGDCRYLGKHFIKKYMIERNYLKLFVIKII